VEGLAWEKYSILALGIWLYSSKYRDMLGYIYHQCWGASNIKKYIQHHVNKQTREKFQLFRDLTEDFPIILLKIRPKHILINLFQILNTLLWLYFHVSTFVWKLLAFSFKSSTIQRYYVILHCQYHNFSHVCNSTFNFNCIK
jgi:hypothetical protein